MLLIESTNVYNIKDAADKKRKRDKVDNAPPVRKKQDLFNDPDEIGKKRREKLSHADAFRDVSRQLKNKNKMG